MTDNEKKKKITIIIIKIRVILYFWTQVMTYKWLVHTKASQTTQRKLDQQNMEFIKTEILKGIKPIVHRIVG